MACPPRSEPESDFRPPRRRPIGVRAPATITDWVMEDSFEDSAAMLLKSCSRAAGATLLPMMTPVPDHLLVAIDHVGIAVPDLDAALEFYASTFGLHSVHEEVNEEQGVREAMLAVGDSDARIQLLAPLNEDSTIAKFIDRNG